MTQQDSGRQCSVTDIAKDFGRFRALDGVSLSFGTGEVVGFLGANGAGKSTTMKIISGFLAPSAGSVRIDGIDQATDPLACRSRIGYLPQDLPLYRDMRVDRYLDHVARLKGIKPAERRAEVVRVCERADLLPVAERHIDKLSGGNRQRVGLAQALLGSPPFLMLDEATAGLDPAQVANFRDLITSLASDHGILMSTHILAEVERCCDRVVVIHQGKNLLEDSVDGLRQLAAKEQRLRLRLQDPEQLAALQGTLQDAEWCESSTQDDREISCLIAGEARNHLVELAQAHGGLAELREERRSLEELFRDLIREQPKAGTEAEKAQPA